MFTGQMNRVSALRRVAIFLCLAVVLTALGGCGKDDNNEAAPAESTAQAQPRAMVPATTDSAATDSLTGAGEMENPAEAGTATGAHESVTADEGALAATKPTGDQSTETKVSSPFNRTQVLATDGAFSLQLGSFSNADNAQNQVKRIGDLGYTTTVEVASLGGQTYHRVVLRGLADRNEAERLGEEIRSQLGITYLIRQK